MRPEPTPQWPGEVAVPSVQAVEGGGKADWRVLLRRLAKLWRRPERDEAYLNWLRHRIAIPVDRPFPIAVLNQKGGVGKTTVVEALGSTFAQARHDRVIAVDLDGGDLAERHGRRNHVSMVDLFTDASVPRYMDERADAYRNGSGLDMLGLPDYAPSEWRFEHDDFVKSVSALKNHYSVVLMDCVKSLKCSVMRAVLLEAGALVIVSGSSVDALKKTRATLNWLRDNGFEHLLPFTVLVVNQTDRSRPTAPASTELGQLSARVATVVMLPFDPHVREGTEISMDRLSKKSRLRHLELAAILSDMSAKRAIPQEHRGHIGAYARSG